MTWRIEWAGQTWTPEDLTGRHVALVCAALGESTWRIDPTAGPVELMSTLAALLAVATGRSLVEAVAYVLTQKWSVVLDALKVGDDVGDGD